MQGQIDAVYITIEDYNETLFEKKAIVRELDNEVGPVKYIAQLLYGTSGTAAVDSAVQFVIMLLIFVFDPLAIILIIAANLSLKERRGDRIIAVASSTRYGNGCCGRGSYKTCRQTRGRHMG